MTSLKSIALIGAGNVAWHLAQAFAHTGHRIAQVYSRDLGHASRIASFVGATPIDDLSLLDASADIFIMAVSDDAIPSLAADLHLGDRLLLHTSGSVPIRVLASATTRYGSLWPVQSLVREMPIDPSNIPFGVQACSPDVQSLIVSLASTLSPKVFALTEEQSRWAHLCAVIVSNFGNAVNALSEELMANHGCDFAMLRPIIEYTALKAQSPHLWRRQTGPAARRDQSTIDSHLQLLDNHKDLAQLYSLMSAIIKQHTDEKTE